MIYIIISVLLFSYNNILWKRNLEKVNTFFLISYRALINSLTGIVALIFLLKALPSPIDLLKITFGSLLGAAGLFFMLTVVKKNSLQWLGIYNLIGIVLTYFHLYFFEKISVKAPLLGLSFIIVGYLFYLIFNYKGTKRISLNNHILLTLMIICFTYSTIIHWKNLSNNINPIVIITNQEFIVLITSILVVFKKFKQEFNFENYKTNFRRVLVMSLFITAALYFSFIGIKITNPLISGLLFLASPLTTIVFSSIFFKEKISLKETIAIVLICIGAFLVHNKTT